MAVTLTPYILAIAGDVAGEDDIQLSPPVWWNTLGSEINADSQSALSNGSLDRATGDIVGDVQYAFQDTYKQGTGSRTGRAFDVVSGTFKDDLVSPWSGRYILFQPDATPATTYEALEHTAFSTTGLTDSLIVLRMGPIGSGTGADSARKASQTYTYLELNYGDPAGSFRIALEFGRPIRVDFYDPLQAAWQPYAVASGTRSLESFLAANDYELRFHVRPNPRGGILVVTLEGLDRSFRLAMGRPLLPTRPGQATGLPLIERFRLSGKNRALSLEIQPARHSAPTIKRGKRYWGDAANNVAKARIIPNTLGETPDGQTVSGAVTTDGNGNLAWQATATLPDAGEGLGSPQSPVFANVIIYIPAVWGRANAPLGLPEELLGSVHLRELKVWDDAARMGGTSGRLLVNNRRGRYTGAFGNYAVNLVTGNGLRAGQRLRGVIGADPDGIQLTRQDPFRFVEMPLRDFFAKMDVALPGEVQLDGFALPTAVRLLAEMGNISPKFLMSLPDVGFPPYPDSYPGYILGKGTGMNMKYRFEADRTVLSVLAELIQDCGEPSPWGGSAIPYYMWFDCTGQFHFQPWNPADQPVVKWYSTNDPDGIGQISDIRVYNSLAQMRSEIILQGQDAYTYELLQYNLPMPLNLLRIGWRHPWLERNSRYATLEYMREIARIAAIQASLPTQVVRMRVPYDPWLEAGMVVGIAEPIALGRMGLFYVTEIDSRIGVRNPESTGEPVYQDCESIVTCRTLESAIPW